MIEIANWIANFFILGLGMLFFGLGAIISLLALFKLTDRK